MTSHELIILGGGLSGLAASKESGAPIFEAADHHGGIAMSDETDGFVFDRGIHVLQTHNKSILKLFDDIGIKFRIVERNAHIYAHNRFSAYPFQINSTGVPIVKRIGCVWYYLTRDKKFTPANYAEWIYKTIGKGFADTFLIPYSEKFWGVHPREMTFEWTGNRVPESNVWQVLRGAFWSKNTRAGTNATFRYPDGAGGYGTVASALHAQLGDRMNLNHRATRIDLANRQVEFANGENVNYRVLLNTIPIPEFVKIASDVPSEINEAVKGLRTNSIMVVNFGIGRANISDKHWVHFPESKFSFFRLSFPYNFSPGLAPPGRSSISAEVSYDVNNPPDIEQLKVQVQNDLIACGILRDTDQIVATCTYAIPYAYCIYDKHRQKTLPLVKDWLKQWDVVLGGRYGLWTYFWSDEAVLSGLKTGAKATKLLEKLKNQIN
jgi:UDP-galactopyranose mutase